MCLYTIHIYTLLHTEGNLSSSQIAASISCAEEICTESIDALLQLAKWQMQKKRNQTITHNYSLCLLRTAGIQQVVLLSSKETPGKLCRMKRCDVSDSLCHRCWVLVNAANDLYRLFALQLSADTSAIVACHAAMCDSQVRTGETKNNSVELCVCARVCWGVGEFVYLRPRLMLSQTIHSLLRWLCCTLLQHTLVLMSTFPSTKTGCSQLWCIRFANCRYCWLYTDTYTYAYTYTCTKTYIYLYIYIYICTYMYT